MKRQRVFISGVGAVSPLGPDWTSTWEGLLAGRSGVRRIRHFDCSTFETQIAAEVDWDEAQPGDLSEGELSGRAIRLGLKASVEAIESAGLDPQLLGSRRSGVFLGCGMGEDLANQHILTPFMAPCCGLESGAEEAFVAQVRDHYDGRRSLWASPEAPGSALARAYRIGGPVRTNLTACAASAQAVGEAYWSIACGEIDRALAGGTHGMVHPDGIMAFSKLGALSTRNDEPETASRPFDATRDGFVMGEGAAVLVLESEACLRARGGVPAIEVLGYGVTADGYRATDPDPSGVHVARAIHRALAQAGLTPAAIGYVNAHGTSTSANDSMECRALRQVFGDHADRLPISSIKSMIGHLIAAAGAIEAAATFQSLLEGRVPPTINIRNPDPVCDLDFVPDEARQVDPQYALSNSFGFGGQNVCLLLGRV